MSMSPVAKQRKSKSTSLRTSAIVPYETVKTNRYSMLNRTPNQEENETNSNEEQKQGSTQLQSWVYETSHAEMTLAERLERKRWE